ncbi:MAG: ThiF family adenylyltransferase [Anaerolineales bacterium]|nr:ThiF family adenylyltransferase [Anaerolineales bacterium]
MKLSLSQLKKGLREKHLAFEKEAFSTFSEGSFNLKKEWNSDPTVIWEGEISDPNLKRKYKVEIHYGEDYPFHQPKVYPLDKKINNNRHQNPTPKNSSLPGDICIFQGNFSDWVVGTNCKEIIRRTTKWFLKFENGTLTNELAPPEIEMYYIKEIISSPQVIIAETIADFNNKKHGEFLWLPTKTGKFSFVATLKEESSQESTFRELIRLMNLVSPIDEGDSSNLKIGKWYLLNHEPFDPLPHSTSDLLKLIAKHISELDLNSLVLDIEAKPPPFLALCYKTRFGNIHWLIYELNFTSPPKSKKGDIFGFRKSSAHIKILQINEQNKTKIFLTHHLSKDSLFRRVSHYPLEKLNSSKVLVLGCGSIGSKVIDLLAKSGIENFYIADNDSLKIGNISRHLLPLNKVGFRKVDAVKDYLLQRNPFLDINTFDKDITGKEADFWLTNAIQKADLVISCIGNDATEAWVNYSTMLHSKQTLYCRVYAHATIGEIFLSKPKHICFNCLSELLSEDNTIPRPPQLNFEDMVMFDDADCGASFIPGSASDIDLVSLHCAKVAVDFLSSKTIQNSYWLIRGREFDAERNWKIDERLKQPYSVIGFSPIPRKSCSVCGFEASN